MYLVKNKLPCLRKKKLTIIQDNNEQLDELKLSIYNIQNKLKIARTPSKIINRNSIKDFKINISNSNINNRNNLIKNFLYQKIECKKYLRPIKNLSKSISTSNIQKNTESFFNNDKDEKNKKNNMTYLIFQKFSKKFGNNSNINQITNINKYLLKKNGNDTNGNFLYNDYDDERKETITFIINNNNSKEFIKTKLTKKFPENKIKKININNKLIDNFRFHGKIFNSPALKNIREIKYLQEMVQRKNKKNLYFIYDKNEKSNLLKHDKYNYILKGKIKNMEDQIDNTGKNLKEMDRQLYSYLTNAKNQFYIDTKNIFGKEYL